MSTRWAVNVGSREWCKGWAIFYSVRARRLYQQGDEQGSWEALLNSRMWRLETPWA